MEEEGRQRQGQTEKQCDGEVGVEGERRHTERGSEIGIC